MSRCQNFQEGLIVRALGWGYNTGSFIFAFRKCDGLHKSCMESKDNKQATWGGRFKESPAEQMVRFSESVSFDARLAPLDVQGSQAHARMLGSIGILSQTEVDDICAGLDRILKRIQVGEFEWKAELEDVHMNIEQALREEVPAAAKLHTGRSRNDQVATDMRLFFREAASQLLEEVRQCMLAILSTAERSQSVRIPGYTHLQRAQPVSMAHHFLAYVEMLDRDRSRIFQFRERFNACPLGSGAIAGGTLPLDRAMTARELGFVDSQGYPRVTQNSMDAIADRDAFIEFAHACAQIAIHLSRMSEDLILWASAEFGFVRLPEAYTTGSSLMPQKKNPDSLELIRGKAARIAGALNTLLLLNKNLPLTYNRDLQEDKPPVFDAYDQTVACLRVFGGTVKGMVSNEASCAKAVADPLLLATDVVDYLVLKGLPFRDAHHVVGSLVALSEDQNCPLPELSEAAVSAICPLLTPDWSEVFDLDNALAKRDGPGMPGPSQVAQRIQHWKKVL